MGTVAWHGGAFHINIKSTCTGVTGIYIASYTSPSFSGEEPDRDSSMSQVKLKRGTLMIVTSCLYIGKETGLLLDNPP